MLPFPNFLRHLLLSHSLSSLFFFWLAVTVAAFHLRRCLPPPSPSHTLGFVIYKRAIPVSTIASESCFSTSGRIIDSFRTSLSPKMVEALICTQNWLRGSHVALYHEPTIEEVEFCEMIEKEMAKDASTMLPPKSRS
ncbi:hypothetical protein LguiB_024402 [Lonicera macranthoides]